MNIYTIGYRYKHHWSGALFHIYFFLYNKVISGYLGLLQLCK